MHQHLTYEQENSISIGLYDMLALSKDFDVQIFQLALKILAKKMENEDCYQFLCSKQLEAHLDNVDEKNSLVNDINRLCHLIKILIEHDFNKINYSLQVYENTRKQLVDKIAKDSKIVEYLKFIVHLSAVDKTFIQSSSNSINLLVQMRINLSQQSWQNIKIQDTSIVGGNFNRSNLSGSEFDNVRIDGINLNCFLIVNGHWKKVNQVCFSRDGLTFASASNDGCIILWDLKTGKQKMKLKMKDGIKSLMFSPDNATLASGTVCFSPDGNTLASGSDDCSICLWDVNTGELKSELNRHHSNRVTSVCFSPDGNTLASGSDDCSIDLWDVNTGELKSELNGLSDCVTSVCFSPDGDDYSIRLWDVNTGELKSELNGPSDCVTSVCFPPDGNTLASGSDDYSIRLWDVNTGELKSKLNGHSDCVTSVCFSPDGNTLASGSDDYSIRLWEVNTGELKSKLSGLFHQIDFSTSEKFMNFRNTFQPAHNITKVLISQEYQFQASGLLIFKGQLSNRLGINLKPIFQRKNSIILVKFNK